MNFRAIREAVPSFLDYDKDLLITSQKVNGKKVRIFEVVPPIEESKYSDFSIDVIDDAGLIDKLAVQSPLAISVLSKQDAIYSSAQAIEQLGLQEQVEIKKQKCRLHWMRLINKDNNNNNNKLLNLINNN